jgi:hypothetical protein
MINSNIFNTGTKFVVNQRTEDTAIGPGTTGFISYVMGRDRDYSNVVHIQAVVTKRGKAGKERIELCEMSTPIFDIEDDSMKKIMPEEKRKNYVHITPEPRPGRLFDLCDIDFLGWGYAYTKFLRQLSSKAKHINPWPGDGDHILNVLYNIQDYYSEDAQETKKRYTTPDKKIELIECVRKLESSLAVCSLLYKVKITQLEYIAVKSIEEYKDLILATGSKPSKPVLDLTEQIMTFQRRQHMMNCLHNEFGSRKKRSRDAVTAVGWEG